MPRISVVQVTNRPGGLNVLADSLSRQTFRDFELVLADDLKSQRSPDELALLAPFDVKHFTPRQKGEGDAWNLNRAYNDALDRCSGELLVFLQDYIWISARGLERFWETFEVHPEAFVTGVGHKARHPDSLPVTDVSRPTGISETDERVLAGPGLREAAWTFWELNWASAPRSLMTRFEEDMDAWYGGDNQVVAAKAQAAGRRFYIDGSNECVGYPQSLFGRPPDWEVRHSNKGALQRKVALLLAGNVS